MEKTLIVAGLLAVAMLVVPGAMADDHEEDCFLDARDDGSLLTAALCGDTSGGGRFAGQIGGATGTLLVSECRIIAGAC